MIQCSLDILIINVKHDFVDHDMILISYDMIFVLCSYIPLVKAMDLNSTVYVLDDGVMLSDNLFQFESIEHVAVTCLPLIISILKRHHNTTDTDDSVVLFNLGGWSYGGVVAVAVAKLLQNTPDLCSKLRVSKLFLFDSPLRTSSTSSIYITSDDEDNYIKSINNSGMLVALDDLSVISDGTTTEIVMTKIGTIKSRNIDDDDDIDDNDDDDDDIAFRTKNHFKACTDLLSKYHHRPTENKPLTCPIYDLRPRDNTTYCCPIEAIEELTTGKVTRRVVQGNHWTMLFNEHAISIANILMSYLKE